MTDVVNLCINNHYKHSSHFERASLKQLTQPDVILHTPLLIYLLITAAMTLHQNESKEPLGCTL